MKYLVQGLGLTEIFARLCPGLILLSSAALWLPPPSKDLLDQLKQYEVVLLALGLIAGYTLGLILEVASVWLARRYTWLRIGYQPTELFWRWLRKLQLWPVALLVGFNLPYEVSTSKGLLRIIEQLGQNGIDVDLGKRFSPLDLIWSYRTIVSGPLGERAQPLLRVVENIRARLLFTLGVEFSLLVTAAVALLRIIVEGWPWTLGFDESVSSLAAVSLCEPCSFVVTVGVVLSLLLRPAMARLWRQELFFTFSLSHYVDDASGLLTRRQGADVIPSNLRWF